MSNYGQENSKSHIAYVSDRVRRITEALYRVTDLFSDNEPIKWLLRSDAVKVFEKLSALDGSPIVEGAKNIDGGTRTIGRILQSLELASSGAFISHINFEVLKREYAALKEFIGANSAVLLPQPSKLNLSDAFPAPQIASPYQSSLEKETKTELSEKISDDISDSILNSDSDKQQQNFSAPQNDEKISVAQTVAAKKNPDIPPEVALPLNVSDVVTKKSFVGQINDRENEARLARQKKILDFVKKNGWVGVGDVSVVFERSISEKTIQRELAAMAEVGILRKAGDKRWRRYACI